MTAPMQIMNPGESLQRNRRSPRHYTDQHGRVFYATADGISQQPIGELQPVGFRPPWQPPMRFAKWRRDGDLNFRWDYQSMADELSADVAAYYEQATKFALEHNLPVPDVGGVVDRRISAVFGPAPISPEIPMAADAGDPWLLGVADAAKSDDLAAILQQGTISTGNDALRQIKERIATRMGTITPQNVGTDPVPTNSTSVTYQQFMSEARKSGMSMADIAVAWKTHKENVALDEVAA